MTEDAEDGCALNVFDPALDRDIMWALEFRRQLLFVKSSDSPIDSIDALIAAIDQGLSLFDNCVKSMNATRNEKA